MQTPDRPRGGESGGAVRLQVRCSLTLHCTASWRVFGCRETPRFLSPGFTLCMLRCSNAVHSSQCVFTARMGGFFSNPALCSLARRRMAESLQPWLRTETTGSGHPSRG